MTTPAEDHSRSSRQRYRGFVRDYKHGRLDDEEEDKHKKSGTPAPTGLRGKRREYLRWQELMDAQGRYHDMVLRQMESDGQPKEAWWR